MGVRIDLDANADRPVSLVPTDIEGRRMPWHGGMAVTYADAVQLAADLVRLIIAGEIPQDVPTTGDQVM